MCILNKHEKGIDSLFIYFWYNKVNEINLCCPATHLATWMVSFRIYFYLLRGKASVFSSFFLNCKMTYFRKEGRKEGEREREREKVYVERQEVEREGEMFQKGKHETIPTFSLSYSYC